MVGSNYIDLTNQRFGRLVVKEISHKKHKRIYWKCICDCGNESTTSTNCLRTGDTKSCGCLGIETKKNNLKIAQQKRRETVFGVGALREIYCSYQKGAAARELSFDLTIQEFDFYIRCSCYYCGQDPPLKKKRYAGEKDFYANGIDRVINNIGYIKGNIVPCCSICNKAKNNLSINEFEAWMKRISTAYRG